jgi:hypothetical protein
MEQVINDKFKLLGKWFWIGIIIGFLNPVAGVIFGLALAFEKEHRKEGTIITLFALACFTLRYSLYIWLANSGYLPQQTNLLETR